MAWKRTIFLNLGVGAAAAAVSASFVPVGFWDGSKQAFLAALSVIAAGVLVRLARGLPFNNVDQYEVEEIRSLTSAIEQIIRSLRALIFIVLAAMIFLVIAKPITDWLVSATELKWIASVFSGFVGLLLGYAFFRMVQVVQGDYSLTILQSKFLIRAVERKQAKAFDQRHDGTSSSSIVLPEGYGRIVQ